MDLFLIFSSRLKLKSKPIGIDIERHRDRDRRIHFKKVNAIDFIKKNKKKFDLIMIKQTIHLLKFEEIKKLRENAGYATEITFDYKKRDRQKKTRQDARKEREKNRKQENFSLNVGKTPETVVSTVPQQIPESTSTSTVVTPNTVDDGAGIGPKPFSLGDIETPDTTSSSQKDLLDITN